jgi:hypothetical protein
MNDNNSDKTKGWWFSVFFMLLVVGLILFLSFFKIVDENRDILIGVIGVLTGSISSMLTIASGRSPEEIEELKSKLEQANADRASLIARLRDAQIHLQLKSDQLFEIQTALIEKLSIFQNEGVIKTKKDTQVHLNDKVEQWLPKVEEEKEQE